MESYCCLTLHINTSVKGGADMYNVNAGVKVRAMSALFRSDRLLSAVDAAFL